MQLWSLGGDSRKNSASSDDENNNNNERKSKSLLQKGRQLVRQQSGSQTSEKPLSTMTGHSGPVTGVKLSLPFALSAAGCAVRLWDVTQGTCLKLLQHDEDSPVTTMTWTSTFKAGCVKFKGESDSSRK